MIIAKVKNKVGYGKGSRGIEIRFEIVHRLVREALKEKVTFE